MTGGAGYVGSACMRWLLKAGVDAIAYDNLSLGHAQSVPLDRLIVGDIHDSDALRAAFVHSQPDGVMHFAASAYVGESVVDPERYYRNNVAGTLSILQVMRESRVNRLLFSSTCATYGIPEVMPITENTPQSPVNPYGRTKLAVEWMIKDFAAAYGQGCTILRYFNAAGASPDGHYGEDHTPETHLIPLALKAAMGDHEALKVFGSDYPTPDGTCIRDYIHIDDLADAHLKAINNTDPGITREYNVGTGSGVSVREVISACEQVTGRTVPYEMVDRRVGDPPTLVANASELMQELDWQPEYSTITPIVETAWRWHSRMPDGYQ